MRPKHVPLAATPMSPSRIVRANYWQRSGNSCPLSGGIADPASLNNRISDCKTSMNNPARILVVDDNETNRDILITRLEKHGYQLLQAADGEEALASVAQHSPDLILLDVEMPKLDGFEVCRRLKNDPAMPFIPIILVTARAASQDVVTGLDAGADAYLTKPIDAG